MSYELHTFVDIQFSAIQLKCTYIYSNSFFPIYSARIPLNNCAHSVKSMKLGMVVDVYVTFEKILGGNFLKSKWPPKSKMAAIIYSFSKNCCSGCVYHKTIHKIGIIAHIYIELQTRMIHIQIELQNGRQIQDGRHEFTF